MARGGVKFDRKRLREERLARGWSIEQLAQKAGFSDRRLRDLEKMSDATAMPETLACFAKALEVPFSTLVPPSPEAQEGHVTAPSPAAVAPLNAFYEPTRLESLVALERTLPAAAPFLRGERAIERLTAKRVQDVFSAYAARADQRFCVTGRVVTHRGASAHECRLLGCRNGMASRFLLFVPVRDDDGLSVTVHTSRAEETLSLQEKADCLATIIVRVHLAPEDAAERGFGFAFFQSKTPRPWTFIVESVTDDDPGAEAAPRTATTPKRPD